MVIYDHKTFIVEALGLFELAFVVNTLLNKMILINTNVLSLNWKMIVRLLYEVLRISADD